MPFCQRSMSATVNEVCPGSDGAAAGAVALS
jgi:hypothetical protein